MPLVLGVDSSTQVDQGRGARRRHRRARRARATRRIPPTTPPRSEQDPDAWWDAFELARAPACPRSTRSRSRANSTAWWCSTTRFAVIRPAKLWNDTESAPDAHGCRSKLDDEAWARACGSVPVAAFTITKLSWLHRSEPDIVGAARARVPPARLADVEAERRVRDRSRRRVGHRLLLGRRRARTGSTCSAIVDARRRLVDARAASAARRSSAAGTWDVQSSRPAPATTWPAALGIGLAAGRRRDLDRHVGHRVRSERDADVRRVGRGRGLRRRDRPLPARSSARSTRRR